MRSAAAKWRLFAAIFLVGLLADQGTKFLAVDRLTTAFERAGARSVGEKLSAFWTLRHLEPMTKGPHTVFRPWWRMNYVENPNAAFGLGAFLPPGPRYAVFLLFATGALGAILWYYRRLRPEQWLHQVTLALVFTGATGNFVDRLARRYVIDFIEWHWWNRPDLVWPTFNLADSFLSVGIVLLLFLPQGKEGPKKAE